MKQSLVRHATAAAGSGGSQGGMKGTMIKGYKFMDVAQSLSANDVMLMRKFRGGGQYMAWPGTPLQMIAEATLTMPDNLRTLHAIFGRNDTPIDIILDIDAPLPKGLTPEAAKEQQRAIVYDALEHLSGEIKGSGETVESQVVLQSQTLEKASFHIHTKLKDAAFHDYRSLQTYLDGFGKKVPTYDRAIYRPCGSLRMFRSFKDDNRSPMMIFPEKEASLGVEVSNLSAAVHSLCLRPIGTFSRTLKLASSAWSPGKPLERTPEQLAEGTPLPSVPIPFTKSEALRNIKEAILLIDAEYAEHWKDWVSVTLCLYDLGKQFEMHKMKDWERTVMEEMHFLCHEFSKKAPHKYDARKVEEYWVKVCRSRIPGTTTINWMSSYKNLIRKSKCSPGTVAKFVPASSAQLTPMPTETPETEQS